MLLRDFYIIERSERWENALITYTEKIIGEIMDLLNRLNARTEDKKLQ